MGHLPSEETDGGKWECSRKVTVHLILCLSAGAPVEMSYERCLEIHGNTHTHTHTHTFTCKIMVFFIICRRLDLQLLLVFPLIFQWQSAEGLRSPEWSCQVSHNLVLGNGLQSSSKGQPAVKHQDPWWLGGGWLLEYLDVS